MEGLHLGLSTSGSGAHAYTMLRGAIILTIHSHYVLYSNSRDLS